MEILSEKNIDTYRSLLKRRAIKPEEFVMGGNSLRSDIVPVVALGARGVHIPYHVTWDHEQVSDDALPGEGWYRLRTIAELAPLLRSLDVPMAKDAPEHTHSRTRGVRVRKFPVLQLPSWLRLR